VPQLAVARLTTDAQNRAKRLGLAALAGCVTLASFSQALNLATRLAQTSDSVQSFVAAHAVVGGNVLLANWHFPVDNYYFTDVLPYAALEWICGSRPFLLALVPAFFYFLFVCAALLASVRPAQHPRQVLLLLATIALLLGTPVWIGKWNPLLLSDMHMATVVGAFVTIAFCAHVAASRRPNIVFCVALPLLAALTVASDPFSLVFAFGPALATLEIDSIRSRTSLHARLALTLLACGILSGAALPFVLSALDGFSIENDVSTHFIAVPLLGRNLLSVLSGLLTLFGVTTGIEIGWRAILLLILRCSALVIAIAAMARAVRHLFGRTPLFDRLLCAGILTDLAACVVSAQFAKGISGATIWTGGAPMRFLVPVFLFGAVLAAREIPSMLSRLPAARLHPAATAPLALFAAGTVFAGGWLSNTDVRPRWIVNNPPAAAARWLVAHGLTQGVGEYWSANLVTAMSGNGVEVRSVVPQDGKLVSYIWVEDARFYARAPQFMIWKDANNTGVTIAEIRATYAICRMNTVAGYDIAVLRAPPQTSDCDN
jgi:hypothetical protein